MKKIVLSAIVGVFLSVVMYHFAPPAGASVEEAAFAATTTAFAAIAVATPFAAAFAFFAFLIVALTVPSVAVAFTVAFLVLVFVVAEEENLQFRWVLPVYAITVLTIWNALTVGNLGWSIAIALSGIALLLGLLVAHSRLAALAAPPATVSPPV